MIVEYDKSFEKWLSKIKAISILHRIEKSIIKAENANSIEQIPNSIKLTGHKRYYRIKIGDYRLGYEKNQQNNHKINNHCSQEGNIQKIPVNNNTCIIE